MCKVLLVSVALESPDQPEVIQLIAELDAYQDSLYPPEARYALDLVSLTQDDVRFAVARDGEGEAIGCGAVVLLPGYGELKRLFVRPGSRGMGVAEKLLSFLEHEAVKAGCDCLKLETGPYQDAALGFYARRGYRRCAAFGDYPEHPLSVFMEKPLHPDARRSDRGQGPPLGLTD